VKLLLESWRKYVNEMISSAELTQFDQKYKDSANVAATAQDLIALGWDPKAVQHHKNEDPPYSEIRNIVLNLDKYSAPNSAEMISAKEIYMDPDSLKDREQKYQDYKSGKIDKYFRDTDANPDKIDFEKAPPVTVVQQNNGSLEVADGMHRVFLAKKNNADLPAWVVRLK
tara:strand:- start:251 stop:760 length:510 start_codon:yes stop_codon:yes gene_type:complete